MNGFDFKGKGSRESSEEKLKEEWSLLFLIMGIILEEFFFLFLNWNGFYFFIRKIFVLVVYCLCLVVVFVNLEVFKKKIGYGLRVVRKWMKIFLKILLMMENLV